MLFWVRPNYGEDISIGINPEISGIPVIGASLQTDKLIEITFFRILDKHMYISGRRPAALKRFILK